MFWAGGAGGFFGGTLARSGVEVCFISRGAHLEALRASGLRVASIHGDFEVAPVVGEWSSMQSGRLGRFVEVCQSAGFTAEQSSDIRGMAL